MKQSLYILIILYFFMACDDSLDTEPKFIVEGFVFAGEPVRNIKVKEQLSITESDSVERLIEDAHVLLKKEDMEYILQYEEGLYKYFGNDLTISPGDELRLEVTVVDRKAYAETVVPQPTSGLSLSHNQMAIPKLRLSFNLVEQLTKLFFDVRITARWDDPSNELHFIVIEPVVDQFDSIFPAGFPQEGIDFLSSFKFAPQALEEDTFSIVGLAFESFGRHRAKVYKVNQEYANLFNNPEQDSRDLTAPPTNVVNGFGIFSAFAADSIFFEIVRE